MKKIYIASAYGRRRGLPEAEITRNVERAKLLGVIVKDAGCNPFIPHLYHYLSIDYPFITEDEWMGLCLDWVGSCAAVLTGEWSAGVLKEVRQAESLGIPVLTDLLEFYKFLEKCDAVR